MPPQAKSRCFHFYMRKECLEGDMCNHCRGIYFDILLLLPKVKNPERLGPARLEPHEADGWKRWPCHGPCGVTVSAPAVAVSGESAMAAAQAAELGGGPAGLSSRAKRQPRRQLGPQEDRGGRAQASASRTCDKRASLCVRLACAVAVGTVARRRKRRDPPTVP